MTAARGRARPHPHGLGEAGEGGPKGPQLIIHCKYANELPKPPVPKLLKALPVSEKLCHYRPTSLELDHRPFLLLERDLFSRFNLVDNDAYGELPAKGSMPPPPPPLDAQLLRDDDVSEEVKEAERKRRRLTERTEAWHRQAFGLQLPTLVTNDVFTERQRYTTGLAAAEKKLTRDPPGFGSTEELAGRIEQTFEDARAEPVHPTKPHLKPTRVLPVVPDAVLWANRYRQIIFDELPPGREEPLRQDLLFKTTPNPRATCFGYFRPDGDGGELGSFGLQQNYFWDNRGAFTRACNLREGEGILLSMPPSDEKFGEVRFVPVPMFMRLKKQKAHRLDINLEMQALNVKYRDPSAQEAEEEQNRMGPVLREADEETAKEASFRYVDGEWQIENVPLPSAAGSAAGSQPPTPPSSPPPRREAGSAA